MNIPAASLAKIFGASVIVLAAVAIGYQFGARSLGEVLETAQEPIVKLSYSGGMLMDEDVATSWKAIYADGRVVMVTRGGDTAELSSITNSQVTALRELINAPDAVEARFPKSERRYCASDVDGIDTEIELTRNDGKTVSYSDCEYDLYGDDLHLLTVVNFLTRQTGD